MRVLPNIRFGTERYPDKVARRLRTLNIGTWIAAATAGFNALVIFFSFSDLWWLALANTVAMLLYAGAPLLHRLGPLAAPLTVIIMFYVEMLLALCLFGTSIGVQFYILLGAALVVLYFGPERISLTIAFGAIAAALIIAVQLTVPHDTGLLPQPLIVASLVTSVVVSWECLC